ncbi:MAG TPA: P-type DNA transfer ATPase VirB11 [Caulobacteraceae bacterium]|nr:P-type DNA transfer ATPase VirB11 [Caulobacteraceae bacterium]
MNDRVYLRRYLAPFDEWLNRPDVTDILVNRPGEVWVETVGGQTSRHDAPQITETDLARLARQVAGAASQGVNREQPLLSASLPDGARVQIIAPPATRAGLVLAIRKHAISDLSIGELSRSGLFDPCGRAAGGPNADADLDALLAAGDYMAFLSQAVRRRKTIVLAGGTSSGKTTLLNALVKEIDPAERLLVIEDAPEIRLDHPNAIGLIAVRGEAGEARVSAEDLLQAALRMRPDRIMLGELRGSEAFAYLRAVNTGHPGSITTVHADSPDGAIDQITMLALLSGVEMGWAAIQAYARRVVDVVVQLRRVNGRRVVSEIVFRP